MLLVSLLLLAWHIHWRLTLPPDYRHDPNGNGVVALMLLFNTLAFQFQYWPLSSYPRRRAVNQQTLDP